jgi:hypothetical protein
MAGRWQFSLGSLMLFTTAFAVWLSEITLSVRALFSQEDPSDAKRELLRPDFLICWGIGSLVVFCAFLLIARKTTVAVLLGLVLIVLSFPIFLLPNIITGFEFLDGIGH